MSGFEYIILILKIFTKMFSGLFIDKSTVLLIIYLVIVNELFIMILELGVVVFFFFNEHIKTCLVVRKKK